MRFFPVAAFTPTPPPVAARSPTPVSPPGREQGLAPVWAMPAGHLVMRQTPLRLGPTPWQPLGVPWPGGSAVGPMARAVLWQRLRQNCPFQPWPFYPGFWR